jgi:hypothetical protein
MKYLLTGLIRVYQSIAGFFIPYPVCRFEPSCSHYAAEAIGKYGIVKGAMLAAYRVLRCNPFFRGGYDPVK